MTDRVFRSILCYVFLGFGLAGVTAPSIFGQESAECDARRFRKPKFSIAWKYTGQKVGMRIMINPKHQTDENFILLARYFSQRYCKADQIIVVVFDNKKDARAFSVNNVPRIPDTARVMYYLNRKENKEKLVRIKVINNAQVETPIELK